MYFVFIFINMNTKHIFNLKPTPKDHPCHFSNFKVAAPSVVKLPIKIDLRDTGLLDSVYNQGSIGSCTGNGFGAAFNYDLKLQNLKSLEPNPSRLFIYYNERLIESKVEEDSGSSLGDGIKALQTYGVCSESTWMYDESKYAIKPNENAYTEALNNILLEFNAVNTIDDIKNALYNKHPIVIGVFLYSSFENMDTEDTGIVTMPAINDEPLGGHCMLIVGYDDEYIFKNSDNIKGCFIVRNSWGPDWGENGYCRISYSYIEQYMMEAYTLKTVK